MASSDEETPPARLQGKNNSRRGLASASEETRERVPKEGGNASHEERGLQAASPEVRSTVAEREDWRGASKGGKGEKKKDSTRQAEPSDSVK